MNYECIMYDQGRGHHKRGVGATPTQAVLSAFRSIYKFELPDSEQEKVEEIDQITVTKLFVSVSPEDEYYENPRTLKEDVPQLRILVRIDRTKEHMYAPIGHIRPII